jgi:hypothetical protein
MPRSARAPTMSSDTPSAANVVLDMWVGLLLSASMGGRLGTLEVAEER